jgi:hypothetical protein
VADKRVPTSTNLTFNRVASWGTALNRLILITVNNLLSANVSASQFGLEPGASLAEIRKNVTLKQVEPYVYSASILPNGNAAFEDYRLLITPKQGLCKIVAWTPAITSSSFGDSVEAKFDDLFEALTSKYGNSKKYDFLRSGSIWDDSEDWMMGLAKGDRSLAAYWDEEEHSTLPNELIGIELEAKGINSESALISLTYELNNFSECRTWVKSQQNSSL